MSEKKQTHERRQMYTTRYEGFLGSTALRFIEIQRPDGSVRVELFSIRDEEGKPYFNAHLIKDLELVCFDANKTISFDGDPLFRIQSMKDRDLQTSSSQII